MEKLLLAEHLLSLHSLLQINIVLWISLSNLVSNCELLYFLVGLQFWHCLEELLLLLFERLLLHVSYPLVNREKLLQLLLVVEDLLLVQGLLRGRAGHVLSELLLQLLCHFPLLLLVVSLLEDLVLSERDPLFVLQLDYLSFLHLYFINEPISSLLVRGVGRGQGRFLRGNQKAVQEEGLGEPPRQSSPGTVTEIQRAFSGDKRGLQHSL